MAISPETFGLWPLTQAPSWSGVWIQACGWHACTKPVYFHDQENNYTTLGVISRGSLEFGETMTTTRGLGKGDVFVTWKDRPFTYYATDRRPGQNRFAWLRLVGERADAFAHALGFSVDCPAFAASDPGLVDRTISSLYHLARENPPNLVPETLMLLHRMMPGFRFKQPRPAREASLATLVYAFMQDEVQRGLNVEEIAKIFKVSRSSLYHHCRRAFGKSPVELLIESRVKRARQLLRGENAYSVTDIAAACGYKDVTHFITQFRKQTGLSPRRYREQHA